MSIIDISNKILQYNGYDIHFVFCKKTKQYYFNFNDITKILHCNITTKIRGQLIYPGITVSSSYIDITPEDRKLINSNARFIQDNNICHIKYFGNRDAMNWLINEVLPKFKAHYATILNSQNFGSNVFINILNNNRITKDKSTILKPSNDLQKIVEPIIETKIEDIADLINLGKQYSEKNRYFQDIDLKILYDLIDPLTKLNDMIGMLSVKSKIFDHVIYFVQGFHKTNKRQNMMHIALYGEPGCGKTEVGKILGKIYNKIGILKNNAVKIVSRSDLIGRYCGETAIKTQNIINECTGGVLFIDEAHSLCNHKGLSGGDNFGTECINTLVMNLSEKRDFLCIVAGYKKQMIEQFFGSNCGLDSRFPFKYNIETYNYEQLCDIFVLKIKEDNWQFENGYKQLEELKNIFKQNELNLPGYGRDVETLLFNCKINHSKRVLVLNKSFKKFLTLEDVNNGFISLVNSKM